jgi:hypothetical protein
MFQNWEEYYQKYLEIYKVELNILFTELRKSRRIPSWRNFLFGSISRSKMKQRWALDARMDFSMGSGQCVEWRHDGNNHGERLVVGLDWRSCKYKRLRGGSWAVKQLSCVN